VLGYACQLEGVAWDEEPAVAQVARQLAVDFRLTDSGVAVELAGRDVTREVRSEEGGRGASAVAALPSVREALLARQRELARAPGLVADGRDMGTAVFPKADLKIFLTASAEARARRRQLQLQAQGDSVSLPRLLEAIRERDARDSSRSVSPLVAAEDAVTIDSTSLSIDEVLAAVLALAAERGIARRAD
jgi:cytidylate kinase